MADYIAQNPSFLVNGFMKAGITGALDGHDPSEDSHNAIESEESDYEESDYDMEDSDMQLY